MSLIRTPYDFGSMVSLGKINGVELVRIFGINSTVTSANPVFISDAGYPATTPYQIFPTTASVIDVNSTNVNDAAAGTGARVVTIEGLDANFAEISEDVTLNGIGVVQTVGLFIRINRAYVKTVGTYGTANQGNINFAHNASGLNMDSMAIGAGTTRSAWYTVPAGKTLLLFDAHIAIEASKQVSIISGFRAEANVVAAPFSPLNLRPAFSLAGSVIDLEDMQVPLRLNEMTDLWWTGQTTGGATAGVSIGVLGQLFTNATWNL